VTDLSLIPWQVRRKYTIDRLLLQDEENDLYSATPRGEETEPVTLRIYRPGLRIEQDLVARLAGAERGPHLPALIAHGRSGTAEGPIWWLVQEYLPDGTLGRLVTGEPWAEERVREAVTAVAACAAAWRAATGRDLGDFRPDDLLIRGLDPLVLAVGHVPTVARYGWTRPAPPEAVRGESGDPATWWTLGVLVHELLTGQPPRFRLGDRSAELDGVPEGRWEPLLAGLLTVDPAARWSAGAVAEWLAGGSPKVAGARRYPPLEFAGRSHPTPAALAMSLTATPAAAESWLADGGHALLRDWLDRDVDDRAFDRAQLDQEPPLIVTSFAATFTPGLRPRYRGFPVDADGLAELAAGGGAGHLVLADVMAGSALAHAARHRCAHPECADDDPEGCVLVRRVKTEVPTVLAEARAALDSVLDTAPGAGGPVPEREWNHGVAVAVELTLAPRSIRRHRRRLRLESLASLRRGGPALVGWWREQRRHALSGPGNEIGTRAAIVAALLLTAAADAEGRRLAEERRAELRRRRDEAAEQGMALLIRLRRAALAAWAEVRLRAPVLARQVTLVLADGGERLAVQLSAVRRRVRARATARYARLLLARAERRKRRSVS
jgi:hypothetical protein